MTQQSEFRSRTGQLTCSPAEIFKFAADMRNFERFVPEGSIDKMNFSQEECSFNVNPVGNVKVVLETKTPCSEIVYNATLLKIQDFSIVLNINGGNNEKAKVLITISAKMNPLMKLMAEKYVAKFLEVIVEEMEKFRDWTLS